MKSGTPETVTIPIAHPAQGAGVTDAAVTAEFLTTYKSSQLHSIALQLGAAAPMTTELRAPRSGNIEGSLSPAELNNGVMQANVALDTGVDTDYVLLDRITIEYWRQFVADDNQLIFSTTEAVSHVLP